MPKPNIAVILFPGTNCEEETLRAIQAVGMDGKIIRWNSAKNLSEYDGFILPGGWSYEDRIRAGIIPAQDPIMNIIKKQAEKGKPVLGICNGCQILIETGMIPCIEDKVQMALAPNKNPLLSGFYCTWTNTKNIGKKTAFNSKIETDEIIPMPIAHAEGRFITRDKNLIKQLTKNKQIIFQYCSKEGKIEDFPVNPNNSINNIAGISNKQGNVLAMMPHPERAAWLRQLPEKNNIKDMEALAPASKVFLSMKEFIKK